MDAPVVKTSTMSLTSSRRHVFVTVSRPYFSLKKKQKHTVYIYPRFLYTVHTYMMHLLGHQLITIALWPIKTQKQVYKNAYITTDGMID